MDTPLGMYYIQIQYCHACSWVLEARMRTRPAEEGAEKADDKGQLENDAPPNPPAATLINYIRGVQFTQTNGGTS